jgi:multidrug efflux pump subunit AcrA (membrane-fusion protein)
MKKKTLYNLSLLLVILALSMTACANQGARPAVSDTALPAAASSSSNAVIAEGHLKPVRAANLSFLARGIVEQVNVKIGDAVRKGDVLARLSNASQAEAGLAAAKLELLSAQQALDTLTRTADANRAAAWDTYQKAQIARAEAQKKWNNINPRDIQNRIDDQQALVNERKQALEDAQTEFDKYKDLDPNNTKRKTAEDNLRAAQRDYDSAIAELEKIQREHDSARAALDAALAAEAEAKYQWEISAGGANQDQLALAQARLENARAQVAAAEAALSNYILTAPFDGIVMDVAVSVGEQVGPEIRAVSIADPSAWVIETSDVTELEVVNIAPAQAVTFTPDALPDLTLKGTVSHISGSSYLQSGDVLYTVYINVEETDPRLKWGMTVQITFEP